MADQSPTKPFIVAYCILRDDLPSLGRGKGQAHAMHAGNHLTSKLVVDPLLAGEKPARDVMDWHAQGGGFGTTLSVGGRDADLATLTALVEAANRLGHAAGLVIDDTYPYEVDAEILPLISQDVHTRAADRTATGWRCYRRETTAAWVLGDHAGLKLLLSRFKLVPND